MNPKTRRAALRAVAQLTWGSGWTVTLACSGLATSSHQEGTGGRLAVAGKPSTEQPGAEPDELPPQQADGGADASGMTSGGSSPSLSGAASLAGGPPSMSGAGGQSEGGAAGASGRAAEECTAPIAFQPDNAVPVSIAEDELACCAAEVLERMGNTEAKTDPSIVNCCTAIVLGSNSRSPHYGSPVRAYCCFDGVVAEQGALFTLPFCTPWGPPVPPPMPGVMA